VFADEKDGERRRKSEMAEEEQGPRDSARGGKKPQPELGGALRSAYERTLEEKIPQEMLDLLRKLG
jgi:hypothetical protein